MVEAKFTIALQPGDRRVLHLIAVTGRGRQTDVAAARAASFNDHFVKPADSEKLLELLDRVGKER